MIVFLGAPLYSRYSRWALPVLGLRAAEVLRDGGDLLLIGARELRGTIYGAPAGTLGFLGVHSANDERYAQAGPYGWWWAWWMGPRR